MGEETVTLNRSQLIAWMSSAKASDCFWTSLKNFLAEDAEWEKKFSANESVKFYREMLGQKIMDICNEYSVTPFNYFWSVDNINETMPSKLEIILENPVSEQFKRAIVESMPATLEVLFGYVNKEGNAE